MATDERNQSTIAFLLERYGFDTPDEFFMGCESTLTLHEVAIEVDKSAGKEALDVTILPQHLRTTARLLAVVVETYALSNSVNAVALELYHKKVDDTHESLTGNCTFKNSTIKYNAVLPPGTQFQSRQLLYGFRGSAVRDFQEICRGITPDNCDYGVYKFAHGTTFTWALSVERDHVSGMYLCPLGKYIQASGGKYEIQKINYSDGTTSQGYHLSAEEGARICRHFRALIEYPRGHVNLNRLFMRVHHGSPNFCLFAQLCVIYMEVPRAV
jgi:hypothetical protein